MTKAEFKKAQELQEQIKQFEDLRYMTLKPNLQFGRSRLWVSTHSSNTIYFAEPELNNLVRDYAERRIKELEDEFQKIGSKD